MELQTLTTTDDAIATPGASELQPAAFVARATKNFYDYTLTELEEQGWIESLDRAHPVGESGRKRFFRITRPGRRALEAETRRLAALVRLAEQRARPKAAT